MSVVRAIIFDYYETLAELTRPIRERTFDDLARSVGADLTPGEAYRHWTELAENDWNVRLGGQKPPLDGAVTSFVAFREVWLTRTAALFRQWGVDGSPDVGAGAYAHAHAQTRVYPDVLPALELLRGRYKLAVLSDADSDFLDASIGGNGLLFDAVVSSEELGAYKPHISMFRAACARLGIEPDEALYIGDNPWADIAGARNACMRAVWMNRHGISWPDGIEKPEVIAASLDELLRLLDSL